MGNTSMWKHKILLKKATVKTITRKRCAQCLQEKQPDVRTLYSPADTSWHFRFCEYNSRPRLRRYADPRLILKSIVRAISKKRKSFRSRCGGTVAMRPRSYDFVHVRTLTWLSEALPAEFFKTLLIFFHAQAML